jgi:hypothetical protein
MSRVSRVCATESEDLAILAMNAPGDIEGMQDVPTAVETFDGWRDEV